MKLRVVLFLVGIAMIVACSEHSTTKNETSGTKSTEASDALAEAREKGSVTINGVERTELALLMRKMHDDLVHIKDSLERGLPVKSRYTEQFERIKSATATEPEKIDASYQAMADAFLDYYERFENSTGNQVEAYNIMLDNCLACHQHKCPGPIKAIKKLRIKPES